MLIKLAGSIERFMADFAEIKWEGHRIKLRASDQLRRFINHLGWFDSMPYFESSDINLDIRFSFPKSTKIKDVKEIRDVITYKWFLCSRNNKPIQIEDGSFRFFNVQGEGVVDFSKAEKFTDFNKLHPKDIFWAVNQGVIFFRQDKAINIGHISEFDHFTIAMIFTKNGVLTSEPKYMGGFTVFDKDKVRHTIIISIIGIIAVVVVGVILKACGIPA